MLLYHNLSFFSREIQLFPFNLYKYIKIMTIFNYNIYKIRTFGTLLTYFAVKELFFVQTTGKNMKILLTNVKICVII